MTVINVNLLPKRYAKRTGKISLGKQGVYVLAGVVGVLLLLGAITGWQLYKMSELQGQMDIAKARTMQLQKDIELVDALIDIKGKITNRLEAVERLDRHRSAWVRILEDFSGNVPDFVWLSKFSEVERASSAASDDSTAANLKRAGVLYDKTDEITLL
jgi:Tfp pilus assembly protein PilN